MEVHSCDSNFIFLAMVSYFSGVLELRWGGDGLRKGKNSILSNRELCTEETHV